MSNQKKPTVRYFINGEYREATVADVGDLQQLRTSIKTDLVSAINSIYNGEHGSSTPTSEELEKFKQQVENITGEVKKIDDSFLVFQDGIKKQMDKSIKESTVSMLEDVKRITEETIKNTDAYKRQMDGIYKEYKESESRLSKSVDASNKEIASTQKSLEEYREKLSGIEIGVNEINSSIDEVNGKFELYAKKTEIDLMEAQIKESNSKIEANAEGLKVKADQTELDNALDRVARFEGEIQATAKKLESKLTREEVIKEIDSEKDYGANLIKGSRDWENWKLIGSAEKLEEKYRNKTILKLSGDNDGFEINVDGLTIGETYTFSISAMTDGDDVTITANDKPMEQQSDGDTILGEGYHRLFVNIIPKNTSETIKVKANGMMAKHFVNITSPKFEKGTKNTPWIQHVDDIFEKTVVYESKLKQLAENLEVQLKSITDLQGELKESNTKISATSDGMEQVSKNVQKVGDQVSEVETTVKSLAGEVSSKITSVELNKALDNLTMDEGNLVTNSAFKDKFNDWSYVASDYSITELDGVNYATISRKGLRKVSVDALTTHFFEVSNYDKIHVSFDVFSTDPQTLDDSRIVYIELFDKKGGRIDRRDYKSEDILGSMIENSVERAKFTYNVDNEGAVKAKVSLALYKNGTLAFSRLNVTKGSVKSFNWKPSSKDTELITTKLSSELKQKADGVLLENAKKQIDSMATEFSDVKSKVDLTAEKLESEITQVKGDMLKRSDMEQTVDGFKRQIVETTSTVEKKIEDIKLKHGEDSYSVNVISTQGNVFKNGVGTTKLMAIVFRGTTDITAQLTNECFSWERLSGNEETDQEWNSSHGVGAKTIDVSSEEILSLTTFNCNVDIDMAEKILNGSE